MATTTEVMRLLKRYGYTHVKSRGSDHLAAYHPSRREPVIVSKTPSEYRALRNTEADLRRHLGLSNRGREAVEGERRQKKPKKWVPEQRLGQGEPAPLRTLAEIRAERRYQGLDKIMRENPYR